MSEPQPMRCAGCGGAIDPTDLGSVMHHEHRGLPEPWGTKGVLMERKRFRMTDEDLKALLEQCRPIPLIMLQCGMPRSAQENANDAWAELGRKMGFDSTTVEPCGTDNHDFTAIPVVA